MAKNEIIGNYRKAYVTVKTFPFVYTAVLLFLCPFETWLSLRWAEALGLLVFACAPSVWLCWRLSKAVKLCPWHRAQCFIMLFPLAIPLCRIFWPEANIVWLWSGVTVILFASLVNAYLVFVRPGGKNSKIFGRII